jgi:hypothetical protein
MIRHRLTRIGLGGLGVIIIIVGILVTTTYYHNRLPQPSQKTDATNVHNLPPGAFTGIITKDDCATATGPIGDIGCSIQVNDTTVTIKHGNRATDQPWGAVTGVADLRTNLVGKHAEVYAHKVSDYTYDLAGSADYYVKILE